MSHNFYCIMNILHKRTLERQVDDTSRKCHVPSPVRPQNWRAESIWYVVSLDLSFAAVLIWFSFPLVSSVWSVLCLQQVLESEHLRDSRYFFMLYQKLPVFQTMGYLTLPYSLAARLTGELSIPLMSESLEFLPLLLTASDAVLSPFPHFGGQLPCTWARSPLPPGRPLSALWSQPSTYCPWTWWRPVLKSVIGGYGWTLWLELLGILIFHIVSHSHYNFLTSLVGFSLPSTVDLSSSCWFILLWFLGQEWQSFYFLYHNQKQRSHKPFS